MLVIMIDQIKIKTKQNRQVNAFYTRAQVAHWQPSSKTNPYEASNTNLLCLHQSNTNMLRLHQSKQHQHAMPSKTNPYEASNTNLLQV